MRYFSIIIFILFVGNVRAQTRYTLEQCIAATQTHTPLAAQTPLLESALSAAKAQLRANYWLQASLNGQATWQSDVTGLPISFPGIEVPSVSKDQYKVTLDLLQPVWDGGMTSSQIKMQEAQTQAEIQKVAVDRYALKEMAVQLYCAALLSQMQDRTFEQTLQDLSSRRARIDEQVLNGTAIPAAAMSLEARQIEIEQLQADARAKRSAALEALAILTGMAFNADDELSLDPVAPSGAQRPELTLFGLQQRAAQAQNGLVQSKFMPRFNAFATLGYGRPGLNFLSDEFEPYAIVGVNFKWNLHPLYTGSANKEKQQIQLTQARIEVQKKQFDWSQQIKRAQFAKDAERLQNTLAQDQKVIRLREQIAATAGVQLENGVITPSEYVTENSNALTARLQAQLHEVQLAQARWMLAFVDGKL